MGAAVCLTSAEEFGGAGREKDSSSSGVGFGFSCCEPAALFLEKGTADFQRSGSGIEVCPEEGTNFPTPKSCGQLGVEEIVPDGVLFDSRHKHLKLIFSQDPHRRRSHFGRHNDLGRICGNETLLHGGFQSVVEGGVDSVNGGGGQAARLPFSLVNTSLGQQAVIKLSQVGGGKFGQRLGTQVWLDVEIDRTAVPAQSSWTKGGCHILVEPFVQPFAQRHIAFFRQIYTLVGRCELTEFGGQFFLGGCGDVAEDGGTVGFVTDHDTTFPSAVVPLAYHTVTGRSTLCHLISLPFLGSYTT